LNFRQQNHKGPQHAPHPRQDVSDRIAAQATGFATNSIQLNAITASS
jgi:hypothetical protein